MPFLQILCSNIKRNNFVNPPDKIKGGKKASALFGELFISIRSENLSPFRGNSLDSSISKVIQANTPATSSKQPTSPHKFYKIFKFRNVLHKLLVEVEKFKNSNDKHSTIEITTPNGKSKGKLFTFQKDNGNIIVGHKDHICTIKKEKSLEQTISKLEAPIREEELNELMNDYENVYYLVKPMDEHDLLPNTTQGKNHLKALLIKFIEITPFALVGYSISKYFGFADKEAAGIAGVTGIVSEFYWKRSNEELLEQLEQEIRNLALNKFDI